MIKLRQHGYKNWCEAIEQISGGHAPHNPRVIYNPKKGFAVRSSLSPLGEGDVVTLPNYEPYGTSQAEYRTAVKFLEGK